MQMFALTAWLALALAVPQTDAPASPGAAVATAPESVKQPPAHGEPRIVSLWISTMDPHAGQTVSGRVETSDNVRYVEARIQYMNTPLHEDAPGRFSLSYTIPWWLPPWLRHAWTLQVIARSVDGVETKRDLPIHVH